jgi:plasmid stability protein
MIAARWIVAQILVRNLEERLKTSLQKRAKENGHSMEAEVREILRDALKAKNAKKVGFGTASVALFSGQGIGLEDGEEIPEIRGMRMQIPDFGE